MQSAPATAAAPGSTQLTSIVLSFSVCRHADLGSAHEGTLCLLPFDGLNKGKSLLTCALHVSGDKSFENQLVFYFVIIVRNVEFKAGRIVSTVWSICVNIL